MLHGLIVDAIDQCSSDPLQADVRFDNVDMALAAGMFTWHQEAAQVAEHLEFVTRSRQLDGSAFWKSLSADTTPVGGPAPPSFGDEHLKVIEYLELLDSCDYDLLKVSTMPHAKELEAFSNDSVFVDAWFRAAFQKKFCSTKQGRLGLAPRATLQGDLIAIFMGADVPFVLRATGTEGYELLGECYIHGIMNGEALIGREAQVGDIVLQ